MAYKESIAEFLEKVSKIGDETDQVNELRKNYSPALGVIVNLCFNENVNWMVPVGPAPYTPQPKESDLEGILYSQYRKFRIFYNSGEYGNLNRVKRESLYIQFLESIAPDDAKLIESIREGKMLCENLTKDLFVTAYPTMANGWKKRT